MTESVGIVCGSCSTFNPVRAKICISCGSSLQLRAAAVDTVGAPSQAKEKEMEQARNYICKQCGASVPPGHRFCGSCGAEVPEEVREMRTEYFGDMQKPGKARLILIRGGKGADGLSFLLQGNEHVAGRDNAEIVFAEDPWVSARHANFIYRGDKLVVRDEGSVNGIYVRLKQPTRVEPGTQFLCGEQIFRVDLAASDTAGPEPDQTYFYSSPRRPSEFRVTQIINGGAEGMVCCSRDNEVTIGREECAMNFPEDIFMSAAHLKVTMDGDGHLNVVDTDSKNGTYLRVKSEQELAHSDYLFVGRQLLRVEMTL